MEWIVQLPILFFAVVVHELAHGIVAYFKGDDTAERMGRLTLNPIPHIDPFGTVMLPLFCYLAHLPMFAWAKPVPVSAHRLNHPRRDLLQVALVGPGSNLTMALTAAVLFKLVSLAAAFGGAFQQTLLDALIFAVNINLFLAFFNLLPIHPLDGSQVLSNLLPEPWRGRYERHIPYGMFILMFLIMTRLVNSWVVVPSRFILEAFSRIGLL
ncbi:MAG: site-2 protease family protein [Elusimicrobia bacterium]|nr:site-2 protease family protein [Elusimicrobiota bacterium]